MAVAASPVFAADSSWGETLESLRAEIVDVRKERDELVRENDALKTQCAEALAIMKGVEPLHHQNRQLSRDLRAARSEKDDVSRRLEISIQKINELMETAKMAASSPSYMEVPKDDTDELMEELRRKRTENKSLESELVELTSALNNHKESSSKKDVEIARVISAANVYFKSQISDLSRLQELFSEAPTKDPKATEKKEKGEDVLSEHLRREVRALKSRFREEKRSKKAAVAEVDRLRSEIMHKADVSESEIGNFERAIEELRNHALSERMTLEQNSVDQQRCISSLEAELARQRQMDPPEPVTVRDPRQDDELRAAAAAATIAADELERSRSDVAILKAQNARLLESAREFGEVENRLREKISAAEGRTAALRRQLESAEAAARDVTNDRDEADRTREAALARVRIVEATVGQHDALMAESKNKIKRLEMTIGLLERGHETQRREAADLCSQREKLVSVVRRQDMTLRGAEESIRCLSSAMAVAEREEKKPDQRLEPEPAPVFVWPCHELPAELREMIEPMVANALVPLDSKLKHVLLTVSRYYNHRMGIAEEQVEQANGFINNCVTIGEEMCARISQAVGASEVSFASIMSDPSQIAVVSELILSLRQQRTTVESRNSQITADMQQILLRLGAQSPAEGEKAIDRIEGENEDLRNTVTGFRKKAKRSECKSREMAACFTSKIKELVSVIEQQSREIDDLAKEKSALAESVRHAEHKLKTVERGVEQLDGNHEYEMSELRDSHAQEIDEIRRNWETEQQSLVEEMGGLTNVIADRDAALVTMKHEVNKWRHASEILTASRKANDDELAASKRENEKLQRAMTSELASQKAQLVAEKDAAVSAMRGRNDELHELLEQLTLSSNKMEARYRTLASKSTGTAIENEQLVARLRGQSEEIQRQMHLNEARLKAALLSADATSCNAIEEERVHSKQEMRRVFATTASIFKHFYDARRELTATENESILESVAMELSRLRAQEDNIRRIIADPTKSAESVVAGLISALGHVN